MYDFQKNVFLFKKSYLFKINISIPCKKFNSVKKNHVSKKVHSLKQTHSAKHEFYFQFSFCNKWTGLNDSEKNI